MRSAGLLGEARMAELGNVGWGWSALGLSLSFLLVIPA